MNANTAIAFAWMSTSAAVIAAIMMTGSLSPLWALFIPALLPTSSD